jgi:hypothetical protein
MRVGIKDRHHAQTRMLGSASLPLAERLMARAQKFAVRAA